MISVAENGKLERFLNRKSLQKILLDLYLNEGGDQSLDKIFDRIGGKKKDAEE